MALISERIKNTQRRKWRKRVHEIKQRIPEWLLAETATADSSSSTVDGKQSPKTYFSHFEMEQKMAACLPPLTVRNCRKIHNISLRYTLNLTSFLSLIYLLCVFHTETLFLHTLSVQRNGKRKTSKLISFFWGFVAQYGEGWSENPVNNHRNYSVALISIFRSGNCYSWRQWIESGQPGITRARTTTNERHTRIYCWNGWVTNKRSTQTVHSTVFVLCGKREKMWVPPTDRPSY